MHQQVGWISEDVHALAQRLRAETGKPLHCDVLIIGSGYGGAVAAARFSAAQFNGRPLRVMLVERGREYLPGMFPSRFGEVPGHVRIKTQDGAPARGNATALWDLRVGDDVNVVLGSGLGGGSLINAAVMARPEPDVWQSGWPAGIDSGRLEQHYRAVEKMLQVATCPEASLPLKFEALNVVSRGLPDRPEIERCNLAVTFQQQETPAQVKQMPCKQCGDCATGCNWQAKNSLDVNYLAQAKRQGASLYCGVLASRISQEGGGWLVHWMPTDESLNWRDQFKDIPIRAGKVIVCAGSLGSTDLLLRSRSEALRFSKMLGAKFSTNGDMIAAAVDVKPETNICASETAPVEDRGIGPTIVGMLRSGRGQGRFVLQEFAVPSPLKTLFAEVVASMDMLRKLPRHDWSIHSPWRSGREPLVKDDEALKHVMVYGLMGDDGARGRLEPIAQEDGAADGCVAIQWPEARYQAVFEAQHEALSRAHASSRQGWYLPNPGWRPLPAALDQVARANGVRGPVTTVHPLGGCPMGDTLDDGVVDWAGRVFDAGEAPADGSSVHDGLVVLDGAIVPRALGINPALTIAALAEHAVSALLQDWRMTTNLTPPLAELPERPIWKSPAPRNEQPTTAILLKEQMHGTVELEGRRYWAELAVNFAPIDDVVKFASDMPRQARFDHVELALYEDRLDKEDEPDWRAQHDVDVSPLWRLTLSGHARVLFRHWSWWGSRVLQTIGNVGQATNTSVPLGWCTKMAIASNIGERRGIDYQLHVDHVEGVSGRECPLQPGAQLRGKKVIENRLDGNPWLQVSNMTLQHRRPGIACRNHVNIGRLALDLRHFVQQRVPLVALYSQPDMATAMLELGAFGLFALRALFKIQLLKFVPPEKKERPIGDRRPGELPGLQIVRHDLRSRLKSQKILLTSYQAALDKPSGVPIMLFHGLTASGSTFAHPSIPGNLVQYLCAQRRQVWVVELPTSIAFDKNNAEDLSFEDVANVIPDVIAFVTSHTSYDQVDLLGHCIGAAMLCRALLRTSDLHKSVRSLVLSQVGPLLQMSPANQLRGYAASYLAQYIGVKTLDARPSFGPGGANSLGQILLDMLLASLPYPEGDRERPLAEQARRQERPDFRVVRHRSDAMLGRLFELTDESPVAESTLDALDEILGYARVQTLAQIIHYTRLSMLTDVDGRNREIRDDRLNERLDFPILIIHGRRSGVFDWRGSLESYEWLRRGHAHSHGLPKGETLRDSEMLHLGLKTERQLCVFEKFGHQDVFIGTRAPSVVFPVIGGFFAQVQPRPIPGPAPINAAWHNRVRRPLSPWEAKLPWVGPMAGWIRRAEDASRYEVSLVLHPCPTHATTRFIAFVPMFRHGDLWRPDGKRDIKVWGHADIRAYTNAIVSPGDSEEADDRDIGSLLRHGAVRLTLARDEVDGISTALLCLSIHKDMPSRPKIARPDASPQRDGLRLRRAVRGLSLDEEMEQAREAVRRFLASPPDDLESGLLRLAKGVFDAHDGAPELSDSPDSRKPLTMAVGSCQYPAGLLDYDLAQRSHARLGARLDVKAPADRALVPQLLLLLGDQVYVDETAGLFEPVLKRGAVDLIYDRAFRQPAFRRVTSRLPTFMMIDDHEVANDWQPPTSIRAISGQDKHSLVRYMWRQACLNPGYRQRPGYRPYPRPAAGIFSFKAMPGGWPLYALDTRTQRQARTPDNFDAARMVPDHALNDLLSWLTTQDEAHPGGPKFVATPSVLLPLERTIENAAGQAAPQWSSDGWAGYPATRSRFLGELVKRGIDNVIFLSGDVHLSAVGKHRLSMNGKSVNAYSVVSSGLYAPWTFANDEVCNHADQGPTSLSYNGSELSVKTDRLRFFSGNGYALVQVKYAKETGGYVLQVEFDQPDGVHSESFALGG